MLKKGAIAMAGILAGAVMLMVVLYAAASKASEQSGSFERVVVPGLWQQTHSLELADNHYIVGRIGERYLLAKENSNRIIITDSALKIQDSVTIRLPDSVHLQRPVIELDSPFFYIKDGALPGIFKGNIDEWIASPILPSAPYFAWAAAMPGDRFAVQATGSIDGDSLQRNILGLVNANGFAPHPELLDAKTTADLFDSRGVLRYSRSLGRLVYIHFYRCTSLVLDSSLHLLSRFNTIDNISQSKVKPLEVNEGVYTMAAPKAIVNKNAQVSNSLLYVNSNVRASNEPESDFKSNSVIDVYDLTNAQYLRSFYIPNSDSEAITTFKVFNISLVATRGKNIILYTLRPKAAA